MQIHCADKHVDTCAKMPLQMRPCRYIHADTPMQLHLCGYTCTEILLQRHSCRDTWADILVQIYSCRYTHADTLMQIHMCKYTRPDTLLEIHSRRYTCADTVVLIHPSIHPSMHPSRHNLQIHPWAKLLSVKANQHKRWHLKSNLTYVHHPTRLLSLLNLTNSIFIGRSIQCPVRSISEVQLNQLWMSHLSSISNSANLKHPTWQIFNVKLCKFFKLKNQRIFSPT